LISPREASRWSLSSWTIICMILSKVCLNDPIEWLYVVKCIQLSFLFFCSAFRSEIWFEWKCCWKYNVPDTSCFSLCA
jgi:hypothetical protein